MDRSVRDDDVHQLLAYDESGAWHLVFDLNAPLPMIVRFTPADGGEPKEVIVNDFLRTRYDDDLSRFAQDALKGKFALAGAHSTLPSGHQH